MATNGKLLEQLNNLNRITDTLNRVVDIPDALETTLTRLVDLMGLEAGWIFLYDPDSQNQWAGRGYVLAAQYNLPPAMATGKPTAWKGGCDCQTMCDKDQLQRAVNEVRCSRLAGARGDKRGLAVHASTPLASGDQTLGILNVAAPAWDSFSEEALVLLTNVGSQMGIAIERARLYVLVRQQHLDEQAALLRLSAKLLDRGQDLDELIEYVTTEVRELLQVDACAILLPDEKVTDLAFWAASGWHGDPVGENRKIPADERSGPGLVMQVQHPFLVEDLHTYDRTDLAFTPQSLDDIPDDALDEVKEVKPARWTSEWIQAEGFRGHAVIPLIVDERSIGVMAINMRQPRMLTDDETRLLQLMANQVAIAIDKARLLRERIRRERLEEEMVIGRKIQLSLLPENNPELPGWEIASFYRAARQIGGDFYDFFQLSNRGNQLGMVIADVSGKGVSAALFMALSRSIIRTKAFTGRRPWDVLRRSNRLIYKDSRSGLFLTACYATLDTRTGHMIYTNAGHNHPLWISAKNGEINELETTGIVLGVFERVHLEEGQIDIDPGDTLIFYTDGVTEAMNEHKELFGEPRLGQTVAANRSAGAQEMLEAIVNAVYDFTGDTPQSDDLTLFVVKRINT